MMRRPGIAPPPVRRARLAWLLQRLAAAAAALTICLTHANSLAASPDTARAPTNARVAVPADSAWLVHLPKAEAVSFRGQIDQDKAGTGPGGMLYPAPSLAGFLVAIAVHGALQSSALSAQQRQMQEEADKVLQPYRSLLEGIRHHELFGIALTTWRDGKRARLVDNADTVDLAWRIRVDPTFTMTQDQTALILYATIAVSSPESPTALVYTNVISVVQRPLQGEGLQAQWTADEGRNLRDVAGRMLGEALTVALADMSEPVTVGDTAFRTLRYREGGSLRIERAAVIGQGCDRWVIRNLRGWIKSVPVPAVTNNPSTCHDSLQIATSAAVVSTPATTAPAAVARPGVTETAPPNPSNDAAPAR